MALTTWGHGRLLGLTEVCVVALLGCVVASPDRIRVTELTTSVLGTLQVEVFDKYDRKVFISEHWLRLRGVEGDASSISRLEQQLGRIVNGKCRTTNERHMFLCPLSQGEPIQICIMLPAGVELSHLRVWNYNKSPLVRLWSARSSPSHGDTLLLLSSSVCSWQCISSTHRTSPKGSKMQRYCWMENVSGGGVCRRAAGTMFSTTPQFYH